MIDPLKLKEFIVGQGWSGYGVVMVEEVKKALEKHEKVFENWISLGYQADMHYLEVMQEDRFHPEKKLPQVRSVIVLQAWYSSDRSMDRNRMEIELKSNSHPPQINQSESLSEINPKSIRKPFGIVARYAHGRDYHKVLKKKLFSLSEWLKAEDSSISTYLSVDSGPTVDRVLAKEAGLGFFGKNANLIDPSKGSYFFIASLMVTAELPITEKKRMPNCGDCTRCITTCPTKAIVAPGVIDARRCISYLTIENKEGIPVELRSAVGDRLFGCDICQEVCPFNEGRAGKQEIRMQDLKAPHGVGDHLDLAEILEIQTDEQFKERFAGTPLMRAKRRGLLRNACVVAGNSGEKKLIPFLKKVLEREGDEMLREHAVWALEKLAPSEYHP